MALALTTATSNQQSSDFPIISRIISIIRQAIPQPLLYYYLHYTTTTTTTTTPPLLLYYLHPLPLLLYLPLVLSGQRCSAEFIDAPITSPTSSLVSIAQLVPWRDFVGIETQRQWFGDRGLWQSTHKVSYTRADTTRLIQHGPWLLDLELRPRSAIFDYTVDGPERRSPSHIFVPPLPDASGAEHSWQSLRLSYPQNCSECRLRDVW